MCIRDSLYSCAVKKPTYRANNSRKTIIIENDSVLKYAEYIGHFGNVNTLEYQKTGDLLKVSGNSLTEKKGIFTLATDLYGSELVLQNDSLIIKDTGEVFYTERFLKEKADKKFTSFYIILEGKKKKITKLNFERIFAHPFLENYTVIEIDKEDAKRKYGINKKYKTAELVAK